MIINLSTTTDKMLYFCSSTNICEAMHSEDQHGTLGYMLHSLELPATDIAKFFRSLNMKT